MGVISTSELSSRVGMGLKYLEESCNPVTGFQTDAIGSSRTSLRSGYYPLEIVTSMNGLDLVGDSLSPKTRSILKEFISPENECGSINFNKDRGVLVPDDVEDTAFYYWLLVRDGLSEKDERIRHISRLIYENKHSSNGIIQVYFKSSDNDNRRRNRLDAVSLAIVMRLLYTIGVDKDALKTEEYLYNWLDSKEYLKGTRYYASPDSFLYFCARAVTQHPRPLLKFRKPLYEAIKTRFVEDDGTDLTLDLSQRILAIGALDEMKAPELENKIEEAVKKLMGQQEARGAWPKDAFYKQGRTETYLGGNVISTIFAVAALQAYEKGFKSKND